MAASDFIGSVSVSSFLLFLFVIVFTLVLGGVLSVIIARYLKKKQTSASFYKPLSRVVLYGTYALGLFVAFHYIIDFNVSASLTALGILGFATVLPMMPILQNIACGILLSIERPFNEEDIVEVNNELCIVKDIGLRRTKLRSLQGKIIVMPNILFIMNIPVVNYSKGEFIRVKINVEVSATADFDKVKEIIEQVLHEDPNILPNLPPRKIHVVTKLFKIPADFFESQKNIQELSPRIYMANVNKQKMSLEVWFWTWDITHREKLVSDFYETLHLEFKKNTIEFG